MSRHSSRSNKQVRFNLPKDHNEEPPSILRRQTRGDIDLDPVMQPSLSRRSSLPATTSMSQSSRLRGLEALHGLREYLKHACNFHGGEYRRALSVPSVDALCELTSFIGKLRGDTQNNMTHADEKILHRLINCSKRHPHEQLNEYEEFISRHARNAVKAHRKRARREADFHLLQFVSRQLHLPVRSLRELSTRQRVERETEAFKERIMKFYGPRLGGNSSAPQSPAGRPLTLPRSPATDPIRWEMQHGRLSGTPHDLFPDEMEELSLPETNDRRSRPSRRTHPKRTPPQQPLTSPYMAVHQTPPQGYQASPYVYAGVPVAGYQRTPPQAPVSMPYATQAYGPQAYVSQGQAFPPQSINLPQSVETPQQTSMTGGAVPGMAIPPSIPGRQAGVAGTQQTAQQQSVPHAGQTGHAQNVGGAHTFLLPMATAIPAVMHRVPQAFGLPGQQYVQGQYVGSSYPQAQQAGQVGQQYHSQQGQSAQMAQYGQGYYSHNGGGSQQQRKQQN